MNKKRLLLLLSCCLLGVFVIIISIIVYPYITQLAAPEYQIKIKNFISEIGILGPFVLLSVQFLQVVIAFIPGEPVEILSGVLYGAYGGLIICSVGNILASALIFSLSKKYGKRMLYFFFGKEKVEQWQWLQDSKKIDIVTFVLFFIPGTPKDMLTYIVGVTEMSFKRFILISTTARVPSVISSALVGDAMRKGNLKMSVILFIIIGVIGLTGLLFRDKILNSCKISNAKSGQCIDILETAHMDRIYPIMYCHIMLDMSLDIGRLVKAVQKSSIYIPEILYAYDLEKGDFMDLGFTSDDVIIANGVQKGYKWDLTKGTQLRIIINKNSLTFAMSHILCDGNGFLQYLYILSDLYNSNDVAYNIKNNRNIQPDLKNIKVKSMTLVQMIQKHMYRTKLDISYAGNSHYCITEVLQKQEFVTVHQKAKSLGLTINDIFMAVYAEVISELNHIRTVVIPCPVNLRSFFAGKRKLTVGNMTGVYTLIIKVQDTITDTAKQIHSQMNLSRKKYQCFAGIDLLNAVQKIIPHKLTRKLCRIFYHIYAVSYSNIGIIDSKKLYFKDCNIKQCFITGAYRTASDFQLSISTFDDVCTLNCTLIGDKDSLKKGKEILKAVKTQILKWECSNS